MISLIYMLTSFSILIALPSHPSVIILSLWCNFFFIDCAQVTKRRHESTPKQKRSKQDENYFEGRSLPHDPNAMKREKDRYEGGFSTPSKSKLNFGSITHDTGDLSRRKAKTYSRKSPATPTNNNNKFSYSTAGGSDSYGQARELQFGNSASNDFKVKQPRISSWRFRNSNKGGMP